MNGQAWARKRTSVRAGRLAALLVLAAGSGTAAANATEYNWPAATGACAGTLQACIDAAAAGDTIDLVPTAPINESLSISKSLTLRPEPLALAPSGQPLPPPVFSASNSISVSATTTSSFYFELDGVVLQSGHIALINQNTAPCTFRVVGVTLETIDASTYYGIAVDNESTSTLLANVENNQVTMPPHAATASHLYAGISVSNRSTGTVTASLSWNHVLDLENETGGAGIYAYVGASDIFAIDGNRVRATQGGGSAGIWVDTGGTVQLVSNAVSGVKSQPGTPAIQVQSTGGRPTASIINNTLTDSAYGLFVTNAVGGMVANNIFLDDGVVLLGSSIGNEYNLIWNVGTLAFTPGPNTVNADPHLADAVNLRIAPGAPSAALDAGNNADLPPFTFYDADQRPRIRRSVVDLGAYESGDFSWQHVATAADAANNWTYLYDPLINCCNYLQVFATASMTRETIDPVADSGYLGVFYDGGLSQFAVFHENTASGMISGAEFNVFSPVYGDRVFTWTVPAGVGTSVCTQISNTNTDNQPNAVLEVTPNWNPSGSSGIYDNHFVNVEYGSGHWYICHDDGTGTPLTAGEAFNVYVSPPLVTPNAFTVQPPDFAATAPLNHPLLNNNPCAAMQVTAEVRTIPTGAGKVAVQYFRQGDSGRWAIIPAPTENGTPATLASGLRYHVLVDGAQANACRDDRIFASGFYQ